MAYISSAPYPPIVDSITPAITKEENIKVYFSLSAYTSIGEIRRDAIMVSIANRHTNETIVKVSENNNSSVLLCPLKVDEDGHYYIEINNRMVTINSGEYYKIQLRFCSASCTAPLYNLKIVPSDYSDYISEWSTVTLIKIISSPQLRLKQFEGGDEHSVYLIPTINLEILGELYFPNAADSEFLSSYYFEIFEGGDIKATDKNERIVKSELLYANSSHQNVVNYIVKEELEFDKNYLLRVHYATTSGYESYEDFYFMTVSFFTVDVEKPIIVATPDNERGLIQVTVRNLDNKKYKGCFVIKRASSIDNFKVWEDLKFFYYDEEKQIQETIEDYLVQSGIYYAYDVVPIPSVGHRTAWKNENNTNNQLQYTMCNFDDIKLIGNKDDFFYVKYNAEIQNFQYTVIESKTDTLGGKYPFIRRNGDTYYRQFSLGGLITHFCIPGYPERYNIDNLKVEPLISTDGINATKQEETFEGKRIKYVEGASETVQTLYENNYYNKDTSLNEYNDYLLEKGYRDNIIKYLYENSIKLFKSPTEGNILVKLMNISLTPNTVLDRLIYNFTSTAFEIDDFSIANCVKYGIWDNGKREENNKSSISTFTYVGQIRIDEDPISSNSSESLGAPFQTINIYDKIREQIEKQDLTSYVDLDKVIWLKFGFLSAPEYFSKGKDGKPSRIVEELTDSSTNSDNNNTYIRDFSYSKKLPEELDSEFLNEKNFKNGYPYVEAFREIAYLVMESSFWNSKGISIPNINDFENWSQTTTSNTNTLSDHARYTQAIVSAMALENSEFINYLINDISISTKLISLLKAILDENNSDIGTSAAALTIYRYSGNFIEDNLLDIYAGKTAFNNNYWRNGIAGNYTYMMPAPDTSLSLLFLRYGVAINGVNFSSIYTDNGDNDMKKILQFLVGLALIVGGACGFGVKKKLSPTTPSNPDENDEKNKNDASIIAGYEIDINDTSMIVAPHGRYELTDKDTNIYQIDIKRNKTNSIKCYIDYAALCFSNSIDISDRTLKSIYRYHIVGQIHQALTQNTDIIQLIEEKHNNLISDNLFGDLIKRQVLCVPYISIEAEPYTISAVSTPMDGDPLRHGINDTGVLTLYDEASAIKSLKIEPYGHDVTVNGEVIYSNNNALKDVLINYICLVQEARY